MSNQSIIGGLPIKPVDKKHQDPFLTGGLDSLSFNEISAFESLSKLNAQTPNAEILQQIQKTTKSFMEYTKPSLTDTGLWFVKEIPLTPQDKPIL